MDDSHHYRMVAVRPDGQRIILVRGLSNERSKRIADQLADEGWAHTFTFATECENCIDSDTGAPMPEGP